MEEKNLAWHQCEEGQWPFRSWIDRHRKDAFARISLLYECVNVEKSAGNLKHYRAMHHLEACVRREVCEWALPKDGPTIDGIQES